MRAESPVVCCRPCLSSSGDLVAPSTLTMFPYADFETQLKLKVRQISSPDRTELGKTLCLRFSSEAAHDRRQPRRRPNPVPEAYARSPGNQRSRMTLPGTFGRRSFRGDQLLVVSFGERYGADGMGANGFTRNILIGDGRPIYAPGSRGSRGGLYVLWSSHTNLRLELRLLL